MPANFKFRHIFYPTRVGPDEPWKGYVDLCNEGDEAGRVKIELRGDMTDQSSLMPNHLGEMLEPGWCLRLWFWHVGPMNYTIHAIMLPEV